ncbi:DUF4157 domain-containing protein [Flavobacterium sp. ST-75]|uniref:DUF4157 domain-containing protein n=1 Tax=Flavobacterium rhizophilum TaxID=3163296 RepID=A0ABW8YDQ0_9FLAO
MEMMYLQNQKNAVTTKHSSFFKPAIQRKLSIGSTNDVYEKEADSMAAKVMRQKDTGQNIMQSGQSVQKCACEEEKLQKKSLNETIAPLAQRPSDETGGSAPNHIESGVNSSKGGGSVMDNSTLNFMESRFGNDFSNVRIHTGANAVQMSRELNAQAFTVGNDIYFNEGKYNPASDNGKHLLAHELTHTIQQGGIKRKMIQKSCHDGNCDTCGGGIKELWVSVFFRVRATRTAMANLRQKINSAKALLKKCCINLKFDFNWNRVRGASSMDAFTPATATDRWRYTADETALGTGTTFSGARGIPMLIVDDVPLSGGGVTVSSTFDLNYTGSDYFIIALNQTNNTTSSIAHELSHIIGRNHNQAGNTSLDDGNGRAVGAAYCNSLRAISS